MVDFDVVLKWMEYIRNNPENAYRFSENFWQSQIDSKKWLLEHVDRSSETICIFGGWYGVLAQFIAHKNPYAYIVTTDIDENCEEVFKQINVGNNIVFKSWNMSQGIPMLLYPDLVINTSSEHVDQDTYDEWWMSIPEGTKYIVQGNNLEIPEHIRIADNLEDFLRINRIDEPVYAGKLKCGHFYRFMAVGIK
jgi:hypothetical protein